MGIIGNVVIVTVGEAPDSPVTFFSVPVIVYVVFAANPSIVPAFIVKLFNN